MNHHLSTPNIQGIVHFRNNTYRVYSLKHRNSRVIPYKWFDIQNWKYSYEEFEKEKGDEIFGELGQIKENFICPFAGEQKDWNVEKVALKDHPDATEGHRVFVRVSCQFRLIQKYERGHWMICGWWEKAPGQREMFAMRLHCLPQHEDSAVAGDCFKAQARLCFLMNYNHRCFKVNRIVLEKESLSRIDSLPTVDGVEACVRVCAVIIFGEGEDQKVLLLKKANKSSAFLKLVYEMESKRYKNYMGNRHTVCSTDLKGMFIEEVEYLRKALRTRKDTNELGILLLEGVHLGRESDIVPVQNTEEELIGLFEGASVDESLISRDGKDDFLTLPGGRMDCMSFELDDMLRCSLHCEIEEETGLKMEVLSDPLHGFELDGTDVDGPYVRRSKVVVYRCNASEESVLIKPSKEFIGYEFVPLNMIEKTLGEGQKRGDFTLLHMNRVRSCLQ